MSCQNFLTLNATSVSGTTKRPSQDWYAFIPGVAVVLDGASDPLEAVDRDGGWYASELGGEILRAIDAQPATCPLPRLLEHAIARTASRYALVPGRSPSSTVLMARLTPDALELLVLGDSTAAVVSPSQEHSYSDTRLSLIAPEVRRSYQEGLSQGQGFSTRHHALLRELVIAQRKHRNRDGGYWIAEAVPDAAHHAITKTFPLTDLEALVLATDGAASAVDTYHLFDGWRSLALAAAQNGVASVVKQIVEVEESDATARCWPRAKKSDDKTLVLIRTH